MQPERLNEARRRAALSVCDQFRRGIITGEHACEKFSLFCIEPLRVADYVGMLPDDLRAVLPAVLAKMPTSDEEWAKFDRYGQFDGSDRTWAEFICECRVNIEAVRACVLGEVSPPAASDFADRIRDVYSKNLETCRPKGVD
ncbi:MAG TPA: hypothetical protein VG733_15640 [Chthoniobacteraceae bacterium]|nr:hypothetical protein [Chthoniobacteraceae bacterium]